MSLLSSQGGQIIIGSSRLSQQSSAYPVDLHLDDGGSASHMRHVVLKRMKSTLARVIWLCDSLSRNNRANSKNGTGAEKRYVPDGLQRRLDRMSTHVDRRVYDCADPSGFSYAWHGLESPLRGLVPSVATPLKARTNPNVIIRNR